MKNNVQINVKKIILIFLTGLLAICLVGLFAFANFNSANADESALPKAKLAYPESNLELTSLSTPTAVYRDKSVVAIIENKEKLTIYFNDELLDTILLNKLEDVKRRDENTLLFTTDARLYEYDLTAKTRKEIKSKGLDFSVSYFDLNSEFVITAYQDSCDFYHLNEDFDKINSNSIKIKNGTNVAINDNNEIFLVLSDGIYNGIYKTDANNLLTGNYTKISTETPSTIIADNEYLYFIKGNDNSIYKIKTSSATTTGALLLPTLETPFELGNINSQNKPTNFSLCEENLLIIINETVQEFSVEKENLVFTGYAIAKGKTAYNRISNTSVEIERYGEKIAVLDNNKLMVINSDIENIYEQNNYQNYLRDKNLADSENLLNDDIKYFALGIDKILYSTSTDNKLELLDLTKNNLQDAILDITPNNLGGNYLIDDICYQSGNFYILLHTSSLSQVYKVSESDSEFNFNLLFESSDTAFNMLTVDVYSNLYLSNGINIYKLSLDNGDYKITSSFGATNVKKLATDLGGVLFALTDSGLFVADFENLTLSPIEINLLDDGDKITSFALNFDKKQVYFICENKEYICYSNELSNLSITDATPNGNYRITDSTADFDNLQIYKVKDNLCANIYSVKNIQNGFIYNGLTVKENEYVKICDIDVGFVKLSALAGSKGVVLIDSNQVEQVSINKLSHPEKVYLTTNVNTYFFPIITKNAEYSLYFNEQPVRLTKESFVNVEEKITFLGNDFYFINTSLDGATVKGYLPVNFTVEVLTEDFVWDNYSLEKVSKTTLYLDSELTNMITELEEGTLVRVMENKNGVCKIVIDKGENEFIEGYISSSAISFDAPKTVVRDILIILAVTASVCGTLTFFLLRKKED